MSARYNTYTYAAFVFLAALAARVSLATMPPIYDELFHKLAAQSIILNSSPTILDGLYDRGIIYTKLISYIFKNFSCDSYFCSRILSVISGSLLPPIIFIWVWQKIGRPEAWLAAIFTIAWPEGIEISQFSRFYALHGTLFFIMFILFFEIINSRRIFYITILFFVSIFIAILSLSLQKTTLIGILCLCISSFLYIASCIKEKRLLLIFISISAVASFLILFIFYGKILEYWGFYTFSITGGRGNVLLYHQYLTDAYPVLWPLTAIACIMTAYRNWILAITISFLIFMGITIHSFAGLKHIRYIYYIMPFLFISWSIMLVMIFRGLKESTLNAAECFLSNLTRRVWLKFFSRALVLGAIGFAIAGNSASTRALKLAVGIDGGRFLDEPRTDWSSVPSLIMPWLERRSVIVSMREIYAIEFIGDFDFSYGRLRFKEIGFIAPGSTKRFADDPRTGRPMTGDLSAVGVVMSCFPSGVFLAEARWWTRNKEPQELISLAESLKVELSVISVDTDANFAFLGWMTPEANQEAVDCENLPVDASHLAADRILEKQ